MKQYSLIVLKKLPDSRLEDILDSLSDSGDHNSDYFEMINSELNRRAEIENSLISKRKQKELEKELKMKALIAELSELESTGKRVVMKAMIEEFGEPYRDDYVLNYTNLTIQSLVKSKYADESCKWEYSSESDMVDHLKTLLYDRVYTHYFRDKKLNETNILRLKAAMARILKGE